MRAATIDIGRGSGPGRSWRRRSCVRARPAAPQAPAPSVPDAAQRELQAVQDQLARAIAEFEGPQQSRSIVLFDDIIARLESLRAARAACPPRGRDILVQAYELPGPRLLQHRPPGEGLGELPLARPAQARPRALARRRSRRRCVDLFNSVKKALVGYLAVSSQPAGGQGHAHRGRASAQDLGLTDFFPLEVLAGDYTVEVARDGYRTETRPVSIAPRATETLRGRRSSAPWPAPSSSPSPRGSRSGSTASCGPPRRAPWLPSSTRRRGRKGLDPARASARTEIANLSLGSHVVELRKKCYETRQAHPRDPGAPGLRRSTPCGWRTRWPRCASPPTRRARASSSTARPRASTPAELEGVCSGKIRLEVKHAAGKFIKDLVLGKDEALTLDCPIRPSLAFLGWWRRPRPASGCSPTPTRSSARTCSSITAPNFIPAPRETVDRILEAGEAHPQRARARAPGADPDLIRKVTEKLAAALEVQGFLWPCSPRSGCSARRVLHLLAAGNAVAEPVGRDLRRVRLLPALHLRGRPAGHASTAPGAASSPWTRCSTRASPCCASCPAARPPQAGIQVGEILVSVRRQAGEAHRRPRSPRSSRRSPRTSWPCSSRAPPAPRAPWS